MGTLTKVNGLIIKNMEWVHLSGKTEPDMKVIGEKAMLVVSVNIIILMAAFMKACLLMMKLMDMENITILTAIFIQVIGNVVKRMEEVN